MTSSERTHGQDRDARAHGEHAVPGGAIRRLPPPGIRPVAGLNGLGHPLGSVRRPAGSPADPSGIDVLRRRGKAVQADQVRLSTKLRHALTPPNGVNAPVEITEAAVQNWLFADGKGGSERTKKLEKVLDLRGFGQKLRSKASSLPEQRIRTVKHLLLVYVVTGKGTVDQADQLSDKLYKSLAAPTFDALSAEAKGALATLGYTANFEAIEVSKTAAQDVVIVAEMVRKISNFLTEEEGSPARPATRRCPTSAAGCRTCPAAPPACRWRRSTGCATGCCGCTPSGRCWAGRRPPSRPP
jgi:hypothetical protein